MRHTTTLRDLEEEFERQPAGIAALTPNQRQSLVVSIARVDGQGIVLSRFGDDVWQLLPTTSNIRLSRSKIDFRRIPESLRGIWKECFYRYIRRGLRKRSVSTTIRDRFQHSVAFAEFLQLLNISRLADVTPFVSSAYVQWRRDKRSAGRAIGRVSLVSSLTAVETLYEVSQFTSDPMPTHPWPDTSASHIAGQTGRPAGKRGGRTPLIPDDVFAKLFQISWGYIEQADELLGIRDRLLEIQETHRHLSVSRVNQLQTAYLLEKGIAGGCTSINMQVRCLRTACYIVLASLSGCRNHELSFLETGACYSTEDDEGNTYWWMRSQSVKTDEGKCEWLIPEAAVRAIKVMERLTKPMQAKIQMELQSRRAANPADVEIAEALRHEHALFLGLRTGKDIVRTLSLHAWGKELSAFTAEHGIAWRLTTHQFRRKFANYAARSQFGDLRYLKEHFKHWSMEMTLGYALNDNQEMALFLEILSELDEIKEGVAAIWLDPREPLSGGYGHNLIVWRGSAAVTMFKDRSQMIRSIAASTAIRSTGHSWCAADDDLCIGNDLEKTRCAGCSNAAIGRAHSAIYSGMYKHLLELAESEDIGPGGRARAQRDLRRCRQVLGDLGFDVEEL